MPSQSFYTPDDVAKILLLNKLTIYNYIRIKKLRAHRFGRIYRISQNSLDEFLENQKL